MSSDPKALMAAIQKVLKEHDVANARVSLDLFEDPEANQENIEIYLEQHGGPSATAPAPKSPSKKYTPGSTRSPVKASSGTVGGSDAAILISGMRNSKEAERVSSPKKADALPRRRNSPSDNRTHMSNPSGSAGRFNKTSSNEYATTRTTTNNNNNNSYNRRGITNEDDNDPVPLDETAPMVDERHLREEEHRTTTTMGSSATASSAYKRGGDSRAGAGDHEEIDPASLKIPDNLMAMLGLGGGAGGAGGSGLQDQLKQEEERQERLRVLKSWVGKSTLLDAKKAREKTTTNPPKQFLSDKTGAPYHQNFKNMANGNANDTLPDLAALTPSGGSNSRVPSLQEPRFKESRVTNSKTVPTSPPKKSLQEMLAEQRAAEARNREGLKQHQKTMEEARKYIAEVEADPERRNLVEFIKNPLTKKPSPPDQPRPTGSAGRSPTHHGSASASTSNSGIQVRRVTLPEDEEAKAALIEQWSKTEAGRKQLESSSNVKYNGYRKSQTDLLKSAEEKDAEYKRILEAAIKYNESLGVKEGKP